MMKMMMVVIVIIMIVMQNEGANLRPNMVISFSQLVLVKCYFGFERAAFRKHICSVASLCFAAVRALSLSLSLLYLQAALGWRQSLAELHT